MNEPELVCYEEQKEIPCCADWDLQCKKLNSFIVLGFIHGDEYDGIPFKFCPWCGKKKSE